MREHWEGPGSITHHMVLGLSHHVGGIGSGKHWKHPCLLLLYSMNTSSSTGNLDSEAETIFQPHHRTGKGSLCPPTEVNNITLYVSEYAVYENRNLTNEESGVRVHTKVQCLTLHP